MAKPYRWGDVPPRGVLRLRVVRENNGLRSQVPPAWKATAAPGPAADTLLQSAGFSDSTPPNDCGDASDSGAEQPNGPSPLTPCDAVAVLYEAVQQAVVSAPVASLELSLRARLTPATLLERGESGSPRTASSHPPNLVGRAIAAAPAFVPSAVPGKSMPLADSDALPTALSSQVPSPSVVTL